MGFFDKLLKKGETVSDTTKELKAYVNGTSMKLADVNDGVFSEGVLGEGMAIRPSDGILVAPCNGVICTIAETKHAIGLQLNNGIQLLLHMGLDTVSMNGEGFTVLVKNEQKVTAGQKLAEFNQNTIREAGFADTVVLIILENEKELPVHFSAYGSVEAGQSTIVELS